MDATLGTRGESTSPEAHGWVGEVIHQEGNGPPGLVTRKVNGFRAVHTTDVHNRLSFWQFPGMAAANLYLLPR